MTRIHNRKTLLTARNAGASGIASFDTSRWGIGTTRDKRWVRFSGWRALGGLRTGSQRRVSRAGLRVRTALLSTRPTFTRTQTCSTL